MKIDLAALSRSLREDARQPPRARHRRTPDSPELVTAMARYRATRRALEEARAIYQAAKQEHQRSKQNLAVLRARAGAVLGADHGRTAAAGEGQDDG